MTQIAIIVGAAASALVALSAPTSNASDLPSAAQNFVNICSAQREKSASKNAKDLKKLGDESYKKIMAANRAVCGCVAIGVHRSDRISAEDKKQVWAMKDFSQNRQPQISKASEGAFQTIVKKCLHALRAVIVREVKKFRPK